MHISVALLRTKQVSEQYTVCGSYNVLKGSDCYCSGLDPCQKTTCACEAQGNRNKKTVVVFEVESSGKKHDVLGIDFNGCTSKQKNPASPVFSRVVVVFLWGL